MVERKSVGQLIDRLKGINQAAEADGPKIGFAKTVIPGVLYRVLDEYQAVRRLDQGKPVIAKVETVGWKHLGSTMVTSTEKTTVRSPERLWDWLSNAAEPALNRASDAAT